MNYIFQVFLIDRNMGTFKPFFYNKFIMYLWLFVKKVG